MRDPLNCTARACPGSARPAPMGGRFTPTPGRALPDQAEEPVK